MQAINQFFKHRNDKRDGGIGFCIKDNISFKTRNDLTKNIVNMDVHRTPWSKYKNTPYLVPVAYQHIPMNQINYYD